MPTAKDRTETKYWWYIAICLCL